MRRAFVFLNLVLSTIILSVLAMFVSLFNKGGGEVHRIGRFWAKTHLAVSGIDAHTEGLDRLPEPPCVFMCNHQSALDIYALMTGLPFSFKWIAKRQLFRIPFFGWAISRAGYVSIDRENPREALKAIDEAARKIREGMNILIFPEGTRSAKGELLPFKKGGFRLALRATVPIVPIGIYGSSALQPKGSFIPRGKGVVYIHIGEPIIIEGMDKSQEASFMDNMRESIAGLIEKGKLLSSQQAE